MRASSLVGHVVELLETLSGSSLPADAVIGGFFRDRRYLGSRDRKFIAETFYGVLRHRRLCDHLLERTEGVLTGVTGEGRSLLRVATFLLAIEPTQTVQIADLVEMIGPGQNNDRFISAVKSMRANGLGDQDDLPPGVRWSYPDWMVERFRREYGSERLPEVLTSLNESAPLSIRVNTLKANVDECSARLAGEGIQTVRGKLAETCLNLQKRMNAFALESFRAGWFEVQDEGSQVLLRIADPKPTDRVLDLCAGAGGKTLGLSAIMKNRGEIIAADVSPYRLKELRKRMRRAGAGNIRIKEGFVEAASDEMFDLVLIDAPCTGVGTIRRNPGMKWSVTEEMVDELSMKQTAILARGAQHVRDGGILLYATCSLFREENEVVVERFLQDHPAYLLEPVDSTSGILREGQDDKEGTFRLSPHVHGTDGFFCARLRKMPEGKEDSGQSPLRAT